MHEFGQPSERLTSQERKCLMANIPVIGQKNFCCVLFAAKLPLGPSADGPITARVKRETAAQRTYTSP
jgi:hypothetical protein